MSGPAGKMMTDDLPMEEDDNPHTIVQALGPSKSFGSKSLGESEKTGVQVRPRKEKANPAPRKTGVTDTRKKSD